MERVVAIGYLGLLLLSKVVHKLLQQAVHKSDASPSLLSLSNSLGHVCVEMHHGSDLCQRTTTRTAMVSPSIYITPLLHHPCFSIFHRNKTSSSSTTIDSIIADDSLTVPHTSTISKQLSKIYFLSSKAWYRLVLLTSISRSHPCSSPPLAHHVVSLSWQSGKQPGHLSFERAVPESI